ncbi:MAG: hypothetical protein U0793_18315 [Gemmataceae bacterium]
MNTPVPICKAFLCCRRVAADQQFKDTCIIGLCSQYEHHRFPASVPVGIFARLASAHGQYRVEIQLQTMEGEVVWREGPAESWNLDNPLFNYDLKFNISLVFPAPGRYELVLMANGAEVARERFTAKLKQRAGNES